MPDQGPPMAMFEREMIEARERETLALHAAVAAIYFADSSDYLTALWSVVRAINPAVAELLESDQSRAYTESRARFLAIEAARAAHPQLPDSA